MDIPNLHKMRLAFVICMFSLMVTSLSGQIVSADGKGVIFNEETIIDLRLHTTGWAIGFGSAEIVQYDRIKWKGLEIGEIKHPKQDRRTFDLLAFGATGSSNRSYVYGKQNNLFTLKYNIGKKRYFTDKAERKGAAFGISYSGGPMLGLVKPYLLDIVTREINNDGSISRGIDELQYDGTNGDIFLDPNEIVGPSGFAKGWDKLKIQPGLHAKVAMHLDWGAFEKFVKGFEMGLQVDFFFKEVPIMVVENNSQLFMNLFISAHLGKRK